MHYITIELKSCIIEGTLTVEVYKNWREKGSNYVILLARLSNVPEYQARAIYNAIEQSNSKPQLKLVSSNSNITNILPFHSKPNLT